MPAPDDLYWNPMHLDPNHEDPYTAGVLQTKPYIDSWDLENYAYLRQHLGSVEVNSDPSSLDSPGQSLSPDMSSSTYYRRYGSSYDRRPFAASNYAYQVGSGHPYDELDEDNDRLYESFGENYGFNYRGYHHHHYGFNKAEERQSQYGGCVPSQSGGRRTSGQDIYLSMNRANPRLSRNRYSESAYDHSVYAKEEVSASVPKRRFSEQPRTDFGRMQVEKQKMQRPLQRDINTIIRRRVSTSGRLPEVAPAFEGAGGTIEEQYVSDMEESFDPEDSTLPIYHSGNRTTMADIHRMAKKRRNSLSYGEYDYDPYHQLSRPSVTPHPLYGRLESVYGLPLGVGGISPLYDDIRTITRAPAVAKPEHFTLGNYGHLQIDYSCNWTHLNRYIKT